VDQQGNPLIGVSVQVKGANKSTLTGDQGLFALSGVPPDAVLVFSFVGLKTKEVKLQGSDSLTVEMEEAITELDEVVAIAYGTARKSDLAGAMAQIKGAVLNEFNNLSAVTALQGRVAGVQITPQNGQP